MFVSFQETEEDLNESEEYKLARNMLDSVKLEGWFQICVLTEIHLFANVHSFCQALIINSRKSESIQSLFLLFTLDVPPQGIKPVCKIWAH